MATNAFDDGLEVLDTASFALISSKTMTFSAGNIDGFSGLTKNQNTGIYYTIVRASGSRYLATLDPLTGTLTEIGDLGDSFTAITFNGNNTLLGITGPASSNPATVYRINTTTASTSSIAALSNNSGQVICYNPIDNQVYHWTGSGEYTAYDTSFVAATSMTLSPFPNTIITAVYKSAGNFLMFHSNFSTVNSIGQVTPNPVSFSGTFTRGLAYITCTRSITPTSTVICGSNPVTLSMSGDASATYQWFNNGVAVSGATLSTLATSDAGYYKCEITDGCGMDSLAAGVTLTLATVPVVSVTGASVVCSGNSIKLTASSGGTSQWYKNGVLISSITTNTLSVSTDGVYNMIKINSNGCKDSAAIGKNSNVLQNPTVTVNSGAICAGESFTIVPDGALTYTYSSLNSVVTPTANETYNVYGIDANGCSNSATSSVTVNALPTLTVNSGAICAGESFTIVADGALTYTYPSLNSVVTPTANETYDVFGTDANGCVNFAISSVTVNALPTLTVNSGAICAGESFTIVADGALTYTYPSLNSVVTPTANETYDVFGTDANGCVNFAISSVTVNILPNVMAMTNNTLICVGQSAILEGSGALTYTWNTTETTTTIVVSPTITADYTVTGTDANGCLNTSVITQDVSVCTQLTNLAGQNDLIKIYPNPTNGVITVELENENSAQIAILNMIGEVVLVDNITVQSTKLNIMSLPTGMYMVNIIQGK